MTVRHFEATHLHKVHARIEEGPIWDAHTEILWFVDILSWTVHRLDPRTGARSSWLAPSTIGWVAPATGGTLIAGLAHGLYRFHPGSGQFTLLQAIETNHVATRVNDGMVDWLGRVWLGTTTDVKTVPCGRFCRFDGHSIDDTGIPPMRITNGPADPPDGRTLYVVDTLAGDISAYQVNQNGLLGRQRAFVKVEPAAGLPDGVTCDADGGVCLGLCGGWRACRYDASGALTDQVRFPVANVTKIAVGGATVGVHMQPPREGLDRDELERQPLAGDVFTFRVLAPGSATREVATR